MPPLLSRRAVLAATGGCDRAPVPASSVTASLAALAGDPALTPPRHRRGNARRLAQRTAARFAVKGS
jgi:hypothetical protein